nr:aggrecan core protein-like isoform X2 [Zootoca vivipara]
MARADKKGKGGRNRPQRKKPETAAKNAPAKPEAKGKTGDLWKRGVTWVNSPVGKAAAACCATVLFLGTVALVTVYVLNYKKHTQKLEAEQRIRDFANTYYPKWNSLNDYGKFAMVVNLSDYFVNLTLLNDELQLEIDDVRQKLNSGWKVFRWNIYLFSNDKVSWAAAVNRCQEVNTNLASISTKEEQLYVDTEVKNQKGTFWIGLKKNPKKPRGLGWVSGEDVKVTYWDSSTRQPDAETGEDCVLVEKVCPLLSCWHDYPCFLQTNYVCKKSPDPKFMGAMP